MSSEMFPWIRPLLRTLACMALLGMPSLSVGLWGDEVDPSKEIEEVSTPDKAADKGPNKATEKNGTINDEESGRNDATMRSKSAALTVEVKGNGKPIAQAEVKIQCPESASWSSQGRTDLAGEATLTCDRRGLAKVRVIKEGWKGELLPEVGLNNGSQRLVITLELLSIP